MYTHFVDVAKSLSLTLFLSSDISQVLTERTSRPSIVRDGTAYAVAEMLLSGITTIVDHGGEVLTHRMFMGSGTNVVNLILCKQNIKLTQ